MGSSSGVAPCGSAVIRITNLVRFHAVISIMTAMSDNSKIEWTEATWNPVTGCTRVSPGCAHCYAERFAERFRGVSGHPFERGFDVQVREERLRQPLDWKKPRRIFVNSMSDLFHEAVPDEYVAQVFDVMTEAERHTFQVLTKRPKRALELAPKLTWPQNLWLGVSVENKTWAHRIDDLREIPAAARFLSCEPLLGPLDELNLAGVHWVIAGGESGPGARRPKPDWFRSLRDQCAALQIPFFFKQWGAFNEDGRRVGKKAAGRELDGLFWDMSPERMLS